MANYWKERSQPYKPGQTAAFKVSRSKIELFVQCQRCFWLDVRLKIKRPDSAPFSLNQAVDGLLKKEFDVYRKKAQPHPLITDNQIKAVPFAHEKIDEWRETFVGIQAVHPPTNLLVFGAPDDIWVDDQGRLIVVDYKATAKDREVSIDAAWQMSYKRQMEVYQWLLRSNGFEVAETGYFVYVNGRLDMEGFAGRLEFTTKVIPYLGNDSWIDSTLEQMKKCMDSDDMPPVGQHIMGGSCQFCGYARSRTELTLKALRSR